MRYLYGDSSAFPLNDNFVETLEAATDCCVALLHVDEAIIQARKTAERANGAAHSELADIDMLTKRIASAFAGSEKLSKATSKVADEVSLLARERFARARNGIKAWRAAILRKAAATCETGTIMQPLQQFMTTHQLPYTSWGLRWKAGRGDEPVQAQVYAIMQRGLTATLGVEIPRKHLWSQPMRVSQLEKGIVIQLMGTNWRGKERMRDEHLDKLYVTRVTRTTEREAIILCKKAKEASSGIRICFREGEVERVTVVRVDENERPCGEPATLSGIDAEVVKGLWKHVGETIADLVACRSQLLAASIHGKSVTEVETPSVMAVAMIQALAPLVRDIVRHSSTAGELQLKRDLGDGRREELFCSHTTITTKYVGLAPRNRALFDEFGLGGAKPPVRSSRPSRRKDPRPSAPVMLRRRQAPQAARRQHASQPAPSRRQPAPQPASQQPQRQPASQRPPHEVTAVTRAHAHSSAPPPPQGLTSSVPPTSSTAAQPVAIPPTALLPTPSLPPARTRSSFPPPEPAPASDRHARFELPAPSMPPQRMSG